MQDLKKCLEEVRSLGWEIKKRTVGKKKKGGGKWERERE